MKPQHSERKHSKFSASGSERWFNCPGSVELSEGMPDKKSVYSIEGEQGHEVLETTTRAMLLGKLPQFPANTPRAMVQHARNAAEFIIGRHKKAPGSEVLVETRIHLGFIHPDMFGTFDSAVVHHFGTLDVFDYKYGLHTVSPKNNLQMCFYGVGLAAKFNWNFKRVRLWIIQPRARGYDGPVFWELSTLELKGYVSQFEEAVERVLTEPDNFKEGSWCHFCKGKTKCPLKQQAKLDKAKAAFSMALLT